MGRNLRNRINKLDEDKAIWVLISLITYLEALERLFENSETLPQSTKVTATTTLEEIDYLLGVFTEKPDSGRRQI